MKEQKIQSRILKQLKDNDIFAFKTIVNNRNGIPDIIVCHGGKFIAIEVKAPGKSLTKLQERNINQIRKSGGIAYVVDDPNVNILDIIYS